MNPPSSSVRKKSSPDAFAASCSLLRSAGVRLRKSATPRVSENAPFTWVTLAAAQFLGEAESISRTAASENGETVRRCAALVTTAAPRRAPDRGTSDAEISSR